MSFSFTPVAHTGNWGNGTNDHLPKWKTNSNQNVTDAVTGATLSSYTTKTFSLDGTDLSGTIVPDGDYKVTIEECWSHGSSNVTKSFTFTKNGAESHLSPADDANFTNVAVDWVPTITGIESVEESNAFSVFPNPTNDRINVDFHANSQTCNIYIINTLGQEVYSEKENKTYSGLKSIDISTFKNGIYFVNVELNSRIQTKIIVLYK